MKAVDSTDSDERTIAQLRAIGVYFLDGFRAELRAQCERSGEHLTRDQRLESFAIVTNKWRYLANHLTFVVTETQNYKLVWVSNREDITWDYYCYR